MNPSFGDQNENPEGDNTLNFYSMFKDMLQKASVSTDENQSVITPEKSSSPGKATPSKSIAEKEIVIDTKKLTSDKDVQFEFFYN
jgi:hypothetical protein